MAVLIVLAALSVLWLIASRQWQRRVILPMTIVIMLCIILTAPLTIELALKAFVLPLPKDAGEPVDAMVILGRGEPFRYQRVNLAVQQWQAGRTSKIFASGRLDAIPILEDLKKQGIPVQRLGGEECSLTTEENGLFTSVILKPQQNQKILLITDAPHMLRSFLVFQRFGYTPIPQVSALSATWSAPKKASVMMREVVGLMSYGLAGRLNPQTAVEMAQSHRSAIKKMMAWNCKV
ncbi:MAG: YdcF family protein [Myxacorys californica WJT36-NPBG1]|jgi:uncharacterized SAM-binding protein YcdF (DUF218 family)|nr:YdcF family protein [Myxacorys californica WJT36-NPBG1]